MRLAIFLIKRIILAAVVADIVVGAIILSLVVAAALGAWVP